MTILAIHSGALGDLVLFGQLLQALREKRGGRIRLLTGRAKGELLAGLGVVDEALDFDALPMEEVFSDRPADECRLRQKLGACDLLVSCFAAGDARAQGRLTELTSAGESLFLPIRPPAGCGGHLLDLWAASAGLPPIPPPRWTVPDEWARQACEALADAGVPPERPYVLIHPGSGSREKCWPLDRFVEFARRLTLVPHGSGRVPVFVLGPTEQDWWGAKAAAALRAEFSALISPALPVLAAAAAAARAFLGNDSGPTHLAAAVGAAVVALFGPTDPAQFGPRGRRVWILAGRPLAARTVDDVLAAAENILRSPRQGSILTVHFQDCRIRTYSAHGP